MFGDWSWLSRRTEEQAGRYDQWLEQVIARCAVLELGAGTAVPTVRYETQRIPGTLIRVNPRETETTGGIAVRSGAMPFLQAVDDLLG
jgi:hypothetical protein